MPWQTYGEMSTYLPYVISAVTLWTWDDSTYIPERYRVQFAQTLRIYCWTGAGIGAFFARGLRYKAS
jgi:hypothetical protein